MEEMWKDVIGYEALYEVSNLGQVRNKERVLMRKGGRKITMRSKPLVTEVLKDGSLKVKLVDANKVKKRFKISYLVAENFIPRKGRETKVIHIDGIVTNNRFDNLKWVVSITKSHETTLAARKESNKNYRLPDTEKVSQWRGIEGFESLYEISDLGHVRSLDRTVKDSRSGTQRVKGRILKQDFEFTARVVLTNKIGKKKGFHVHVLVQNTFARKIEEDEVIVFIDGDRANCSILNLRVEKIKRESSEIVNKGAQIKESFIEGEEWKLYEGSTYEVSDLGRVRNKDSRVLRVGISGEYPRVSFPIDGVKTTRSVHRLIAKAFIPNPDNCPVVNHINGIKHDNRAVNLEWVTHSENTFHAIENKLKGKRTILNEIKDEVSKLLTEEQIDKIFNKYHI